jgi:ubiquinone/menaquinone biosynthesis C-methylase UbiE
MSETSWDVQWNEFFEHSDGNRYPEPMIVRFVMKNYSQLDKNARNRVNVLDLGCGTGPHVWFLAKEGFSTFGIDGSEQAIKKAMARVTAEGLTADLKVGDFVRLPYSDQSMDAVIDASSLQHNDTDSIHKVLDEVRRVLKPNGRLFSVFIAAEREKQHSLVTNYASVEDVRALYGTHFTEVRVGYQEYAWDSLDRDYKYWLIHAMNN